MNMKRNNKLLSALLCIVLTVAMTLFTIGCNDKNTNVDDTPVETSVIGEGATVFSFMVVAEDGTKSAFEIHTDKTIVGEALLKLGLIAGDEGDYGLYVKEVNGILADYDKTGTYWAFYVNDEYAMSGVDTTKINTADKYSFRVEK